MEKASFAAGCFWGVEESFSRLEGVLKTTVGYSDGTLKEPNYKDVCSGSSGHAEICLVEFDPEKVSYGRLLEVFWKIHDPTTLNRQGLDVGTQYRSAIFFHNQEQENLAKSSVLELENSKRFPHSIVTEIKPASEFYEAEDYHQQYLKKQSHP